MKWVRAIALAVSGTTALAQTTTPSLITGTRGRKRRSRSDTLLMVGSGFPYSEFLPKEGNTRGGQIDIDASMLSIRFPMEVGLVGGAVVADQLTG
jgi:thiamine pyrophosphate-dependent acetolactate synthase large subunit-like protein